MSLLRLLADRTLSIDPRSLGLFRILFGLTLLGDLWHRWSWVQAFYTNEGVLPNHNHLFLLMDEGQTWSIYHSFSSIEEAHFAMLLTFGIYACFTLGYKTRALHAASLLCLISLCGRNILFDNVGQSVAIVLCAITLLLPLGARYSLDELGRTLRAREERTPEELNDRALPDRPVKRPSLAALAVLAVLALFYFGAALQQTGATWQDGSALYYALHVDRWTSALGAAVREQSGLLTGWTKALWAVQLGIVPLALVPVARHVTRLVAIAAMLFHALTFGLFFSFGMYGWSLLAAAALLIPEETWQRLDKRTRPLDLYYDADCGVCTWSARMLKRLDSRGNVRFHDNGGELPPGASEAMAERSMIVVDAGGRVSTDAAALSAICLAVRPLWWCGWLLKLPGVHQLARALYHRFAERRFDVSEALGMGACGVEDDGRRSDSDDARGDEDTPAARLWRWLCFAATGAGSLLIVAAAVAQSERVGELGTASGLARVRWLTDIATWARVTAPWGVWAPDPPLANEGLVVDAETRGGWNVDVLTGDAPDLALQRPGHQRRGALWSAYSARIADDEFTPFRKEFRQYLTRGGSSINTRVPENYIQKMSVYWVSVPTPPPGQPRAAEVERREIFTQRGRLGTPRGTKPDPDKVPSLDKLPPFFPKKQQ